MTQADFAMYLEEQGLKPGTVIADGQLHRCPTTSKPGKQNGAYVFYPDAPVSGWYQNFETGGAGTWTSSVSLSEAEKRLLAARAREAKSTRAAQDAARQDKAVQNAEHVLRQSGAVSDTHPYLQRKKVAPLGPVRLGRAGEILLPVRDISGNLHGLQHIYPDGTKRFLAGTKKTGHFAAIDGPEVAKGKPLYICEGYATAASIHMATGAACIIAFDAGNLLSVAQAVRAQKPQARIVLAADNDMDTQGNPGLTKAREAAEAIGAALTAPDLPKGKGSDFNDLHQARGLDAVREQLARLLRKAGKARTDTGRFTLTDKGVFTLVTDEKGDTQSVFVCSVLKVRAYTRDTVAGGWGKLLELVDPDGNTHTLALPLQELAGEGESYRATLLSLGLRIAPGRKGRERLHEYIAMAEPV